MNFNNEVYSTRGCVIGFRCSLCDLVKSTMWGAVCNECRQARKDHDELIRAIREASRIDTP